MENRIFYAAIKMKTNNIQNFLKSMSAALLLPLALTACQSEPEVGSTLYPSEGDEYKAVAYIDNHLYNPKNSMKTVYAQAGTSPNLELPGDTLRLHVKLTAAADKDLTFNLRIDNTKLSQTETENVQVVGDDAYKLERKTVTVKQGRLQSDEAFEVVLNDKSKTLLEMKDGGKGLTAFTFDGSDGIKLSEKYNTFRWELGKEVHWVNPNGTVDNLKMLDVHSYDVLTNYSMPGMELSDDNKDNYARFLIGTHKTSWLRVNLHEETPIAAIQLTPAGMFWGDRLYVLFMKEVEVLGSNDGETYFRLGYATCPFVPTAAQEPWNIVFYSAQPVKYLGIRTISTFSSSQENNPVFVSEMRLFR